MANLRLIKILLVLFKTYLNSAGYGIPLLAYKIFDKMPRRPGPKSILRHKSQIVKFSIPIQKLQQHLRTSLKFRVPGPIPDL